MVTSVHCPPSDKIHFILSWPKLHPVLQWGGGGPLKQNLAHVSLEIRHARQGAFFEVDKKPS